MTRLESMAVGGLIAALLLILYARSVTPALANARPDTSADGRRTISPDASIWSGKEKLA